MADVDKNIPSEAHPYANFNALKVGATFVAGGETYTKTGDMTFVSAESGFEQYIDPLFEKKIGKEVKSQIAIDTSAKIVKGQ